MTQPYTIDHGFGGNDGAWWVRERGVTVQLADLPWRPITQVGHCYMVAQFFAPGLAAHRRADERYGYGSCSTGVCYEPCGDFGGCAR